MNVPTLGSARFDSTRIHTVNDDLRILEHIEMGLQFEVADPRTKLFFDAKAIRAASQPERFQ